MISESKSRHVPLTHPDLLRIVVELQERPERRRLYSVGTLRLVDEILALLSRHVKESKDLHKCNNLMPLGDTNG